MPLSRTTVVMLMGSAGVAGLRTRQRLVEWGLARRTEGRELGGADIPGGDTGDPRVGPSGCQLSQAVFVICFRLMSVFVMVPLKNHGSYAKFHLETNKNESFKETHSATIEQRRHKDDNLGEKNLESQNQQTVS